MTSHDVVFVVGPGDREQLRYSLRSLVNVPHGKVFISGVKPAWVCNVIHVHVPQSGSKFANSTENLLAACRHPDLSPRFYYFNDDFFAMQPMQRIPVLHWGAMSRVRRYYTGGNRGEYLRGLDTTVALLRRWGIENPLSYELHVPIPMNKYRLINVIAKQRADAPHIGAVFKRSMYGNFFDIGGRQSGDAKSMDGARLNKNALFLSSTNGRFRGRPIERHLKQRFPRKSPYET